MIPMKVTTSLFLSFLLTSVCSFGANKVIEVGTKPESVCRGFGGKLYVTMINGNEPGDGEIKMIDGDKITVFAKGLNNPKGMAFVGGFLVASDETMVRKIDKKGKQLIVPDMLAGKLVFLPLE